MTNYDRIAVFERDGSLWLKISGRRGRPPPTICARLDRPCSECLTTLPLKVFSLINFVADFRREKLIFYTANGKFSFLRPLWGLGATYAVHLRLTGKPVVDFLPVIIEHFSLRVKGDELYTTEYILDVAVFEWGESL